MDVMGIADSKQQIFNPQPPKFVSIDNIDIENNIELKSLIQPSLDLANHLTNPHHEFNIGKELVILKHLLEEKDYIIHNIVTKEIKKNVKNIEKFKQETKNQ